MHRLICGHKQYLLLSELSITDSESKAKKKEKKESFSTEKNRYSNDLIITWKDLTKMVEGEKREGD